MWFLKEPVLHDTVALPCTRDHCLNGSANHCRQPPVRSSPARHRNEAQRLRHVYGGGFSGLRSETSTPRTKTEPSGPRSFHPGPGAPMGLVANQSPRDLGHPPSFLSWEMVNGFCGVETLFVRLADEDLFAPSELYSADMGNGLPYGQRKGRKYNK